MEYLNQEVADSVYNASERVADQGMGDGEQFGHVFMKGYIEALKDHGLIDHEQAHELVEQYGNEIPV